MEQFDPRARPDMYGQRINRTSSPWRTRTVPYGSIILASLLPVILIADAMPLAPSFGFLMLLGWRMVRPGLLPLWVGAPLGAFDDLISGQPFGSAILLWSTAMIIIELIETRFPWRGFWQDWFAAGLISTGYWFAAVVVSGAPITREIMMVAASQALIAILLYPVVARTIASLDRFRLARARRID